MRDAQRREHGRASLLGDGHHLGVGQVQRVLEPAGRVLEAIHEPTADGAGCVIGAQVVFGSCAGPDEDVDLAGFERRVDERSAGGRKGQGAGRVVRPADIGAVEPERGQRVRR
jgi:hypothetical protein